MFFVTFPPIIMWKKWVPTVVTFQIRPSSIILGERVGEIQKLNCDSYLTRLKIAFRIFAEIKVLDLPIWVQFNLKEFYQKMMHPWCLSDFNWKKRLKNFIQHPQCQCLLDIQPKTAGRHPFASAGEALTGKLRTAQSPDGQKHMVLRRKETKRLP